MSLFKLSANFAALAALLPLSIPSLAEGNKHMTPDQQTVLATIQKMTASFQAGDIDAVMETYEPDQSIAFEPGNPVSDGALARELFRQFGSVSPKFSYSGHEVIVEGDLAVHIAPWTMTGTDPDGNAVAGEGLSVAVLRRQPDGSWKMVIDNPYGSRLLGEASR
ncbi:YybH family protein [Roseibium sp.]|uniref:YybH family protein n=1 Tax=Roseibium sp. TaxID=1936156 RepID=UPI003D0979D0